MATKKYWKPTPLHKGNSEEIGDETPDSEVVRDYFRLGEFG